MICCFAKVLELRSTENDIFNVLDKFMKAYDINWEKCISICSDGARSMTGKINDAVTTIKNVAKKYKSCIASSTDMFW